MAFLQLNLVRELTTAAAFKQIAYRFDQFKLQLYKNSKNENLPSYVKIGIHIHVYLYISKDVGTR